MEKRAVKAEKQRDDALDRITLQRREIYRLGIELEDEKDRKKTGERVHAPFPARVVNDVNYDGSIKAFLFLLNNECCVSIDKSRKFLSDLTNRKNAYVFVTATPDGEAMYFARAKRGMKVSGVLRQKTIMESLSRIMKNLL